MTDTAHIIPFDKSYRGGIPDGYNIILYEKGEDPEEGFVLYGFDEVGMYEGEFKSPAYAFVRDVI